MVGFEPKTEILPPAQRAFWPELSVIPAHFVLYGGTAIALHLGHRISEDFDFFSRQSFDPQQLMDEVPIFSGAEVLQVAPNTLTIRQHDVKFSFFGLPRMTELNPPIQWNAPVIKIAPLIDLVATKIRVIQVRAEPKDYLDLAAIFSLTEISLADGLAAAQKIYGQNFSRHASLKALVYFDDPALVSLPEDVKEFLVEQVRQTNLE